MEPRSSRGPRNEWLATVRCKAAQANLLSTNHKLAWHFTSITHKEALIIPETVTSPLLLNSVIICIFKKTDHLFKTTTDLQDIQRGFPTLGSSC